jgi:hypothetical protein
MVEVTTEQMELRDPQTGQAWWTEKRPTLAIHAKVKRRLLANFLVPSTDLDGFELPEFLEPVGFRRDAVLLSACIIDMHGAAPDWAPKALAPPCVGAALRVTCVDRRDGSPAVFVDTRFSNSFLTPMMQFLGLGGFQAGLSSVIGKNECVGSVTTPEWELALVPGEPESSAPHFAPEVFDALIAAGVASYGTVNLGKDYGRADLHKYGHTPFVRAERVRAVLYLKGRRYDGDLRTSHGGDYLWNFGGGNNG